jgi:cytochrome b561
MPAWQRFAAHALHAMLYVLMLVQPLTGWIYSNAAGYPIVYLGLLPLPNLVARNKDLAKVFEQLHGTGGLVLAVLIGLHVVAALKHHLVDRDATLRRMLHGRR